MKSRLPIVVVSLCAWLTVVSIASATKTVPPPPVLVNQNTDGDSVPSPLLFWDWNNDGVPDPSVPVVHKGGGWTALALDRFNAAIDEWSTDTQFEPYGVASGSYWVYRDGTAPSGGFDEQDVMVTFVQALWRTDHYDIWMIDTYAQTDADLPSTMERFWYGAAHSASSTDVDFQGVLAHEIGHWVLLVDLGPLEYGSSCNYGTNMYTMCGELTSNYDDESWRMRSLTAQDIASANTVY